MNFDCQKQARAVSYHFMRDGLAALGLCHWSWPAGSSRGSVRQSFVSGSVTEIGEAEAEAGGADAERAGDVELLLLFSSSPRLPMLSVLSVSVLLTAVRAGCSVG